MDEVTKVESVQDEVEVLPQEDLDETVLKEDVPTPWEWPAAEEEDGPAAPPPDRRRPRLPYILIGLALVVGIGGGVALGRATVPPDPQQEKLELIWQTIQDNSIYDPGELPQGDLLYRGLVKSLGDPYADYLTPEQMATEMQETEGMTVGLGVVVKSSRETGEVIVSFVMEGGPAHESGLQAGDVILSLNGRSVHGPGGPDVFWAGIGGGADTQIELELLRPSTGAQYRATLTKRETQIQTVEQGWLETGTGYLFIREFLSTTDDEFRAALDGLVAQGLDRLVLDLRGDPGGSLDAVCAIADYLLPDRMPDNSHRLGRSTIAYTMELGGDSKTYLCSDRKQLDVPIAVLIDEGSASASELLAGALRDHGRAVVVGTTSFGKGLVQSFFELSDGSAVKLTISQYLTPSGYAIDGRGVVPDVVVQRESPLEGFPPVLLPQRMADEQVQAALAALARWDEGTLSIGPTVGAGASQLPPLALLEAQRAEPCQGAHFPGVWTELEQSTFSVLRQLHLQIFSYGDLWVGDGASVGAAQRERQVRLELCSDWEEMGYLDLGVDLITGEIHWFRASQMEPRVCAELIYALSGRIAPKVPVDGPLLYDQLIAMKEGDKAVTFRYTGAQMEVQLLKDGMTATMVATG